jgi:hypothetical protein
MQASSELYEHGSSEDVLFKLEHPPNDWKKIAKNVQRASEVALERKRMY